MYNKFLSGVDRVVASSRLLDGIVNHVSRTLFKEVEAQAGGCTGSYSVTGHCWGSCSPGGPCFSPPCLPGKWTTYMTCRKYENRYYYATNCYRRVFAGTVFMCGYPYEQYCDRENCYSETPCVCQVSPGLANTRHDLYLQDFRFRQDKRQGYADCVALPANNHSINRAFSVLTIGYPLPYNTFYEILF